MLRTVNNPVQQDEVLVLFPGSETESIRQECRGIFCDLTRDLSV